jgi:hypothetical protein
LLKRVHENVGGGRKEEMEEFEKIKTFIDRKITPILNEVTEEEIDFDSYVDIISTYVGISMKAEHEFRKTN